MHADRHTPTPPTRQYRVVTVDKRFFNVLEPKHTDNLRNARTEAHARALRHPHHRTCIIVNRARGTVLFDSARA